MFVQWLQAISVSTMLAMKLQNMRIIFVYIALT